jgi:hypothetical protein
MVALYSSAVDCVLRGLLESRTLCSLGLQAETTESVTSDEKKPFVHLFVFNVFLYNIVHGHGTH